MACWEVLAVGVVGPTVALLHSPQIPTACCYSSSLGNEVVQNWLCFPNPQEQNPAPQISKILPNSNIHLVLTLQYQRNFHMKHMLYSLMCDNVIFFAQIWRINTRRLHDKTAYFLIGTHEYCHKEYFTVRLKDLKLQGPYFSDMDNTYGYNGIHYGYVI